MAPQKLIRLSGSLDDATPNLRQDMKSQQPLNERQHPVIQATRQDTGSYAFVGKSLDTTALSEDTIN